MAKGGSRAPYIIICSGRIDVLQAMGPQAELKAASDCARNLVTYFGDKLTHEQTEPISSLQHSMMDHFSSWGNHEAEIAIEQMFGLLDGLEDQMKS